MIVAPVIRQAEPSDAAAIATCHVRTWQVAYRGQLPDALLDGMTSEIERRTAFWQRVIGERTARRQHQLVAVEDERVVGFATFGPNEQGDDASVGELYSIYLDSERWGRGYGRALFSAAERGLRDDGYRAKRGILRVLSDFRRTLTPDMGFSPKLGENCLHGENDASASLPGSLGVVPARARGRRNCADSECGCG